MNDARANPGHGSIALIGHLGGGEMLLNGQTLRTRLVHREFAKRLGPDRVITVDTARIGRQPWRVLRDIVRCFRQAEVICVMPGERGLKVLMPIFVRLRAFFGRSVHYLVVGGWLPGFLRDRPRLCGQVAQLDGVHVQSRRMQNDLRSLGMTNLHYLPNFREFPHNSQKAEEPQKALLQLVFLSRVIPEKGLALCLHATRSINEASRHPRVSLTIFGPVSSEHRPWLNELLRDNPPNIRYLGPVAPEEVVATLAKHDLLMFPTWYAGEGFPGVVVEAYAAGIPVLASRWQDNEEVIEHGVTGMLVATQDQQALTAALCELLDQPQLLARLKRGARERAASYHVDQVIPSLLQTLGVQVDRPTPA